MNKTTDSHSNIQQRERTCTSTYEVELMGHVFISYRPLTVCVNNFGLFSIFYIVENKKPLALTQTQTLNI